MLARVRSEVREMIQEQFEYWELLYVMCRRDLQLRYKQTIMGFGWAVFMPLLNTILFTLVFTRLAAFPISVPYPVFAYCGLLAWNLTASALRFSVSSLTANINLVAKVYFPREIFPFSSVLVAVVDFAVGAILLVAMMIYYKIAVTPAILFLPVVILVHITFTAAIALFLAMANLFYRDVKYLFEVAITLWMFGSSVLYPLDGLKGPAKLLVTLNPMTPILDAYRSVILLGHLPPLGEFAIVGGVSLVMLGGAWLMFHRSEYQFAELI